jgi:hypothetical protein
LPSHRTLGNLRGEANCIQGIGDVALETGDQALASDRFEQALELYARIRERHSVGSAHRRLARLARHNPQRRDQQLAAARAAWQVIQRPDLIEDLEREFPPDSPTRAAARRPANDPEKLS